MGFMGLRFICLSSAFFFAEKGGKEMRSVAVLEEKVQPIVRVIKAAIFQPMRQRARAD
jgi:hypothetical protein